LLGLTIESYLNEQERPEELCLLAYGDIAAIHPRPTTTPKPSSVNTLNNYKFTVEIASIALIAIITAIYYNYNSYKRLPIVLVTLRVTVGNSGEG